MILTVKTLKDQTAADVGLYHDVEDCVTVIGNVQEDAEVGAPYVCARTGHTLLLRAIHEYDGPDPGCNIAYEVTEISDGAMPQIVGVEPESGEWPEVLDDDDDVDVVVADEDQNNE